MAHQYPWHAGDPDTFFTQDALRYYKSEAGRHEDARSLSLIARIGVERYYLYF